MSQWLDVCHAPTLPDLTNFNKLLQAGRIAGALLGCYVSTMRKFYVICWAVILGVSVNAAAPVFLDDQSPVRIANGSWKCEFAAAATFRYSTVMSAREIIAELPKLTPRERRQIAR